MSGLGEKQEYILEEMEKNNTGSSDYSVGIA